VTGGTGALGASVVDLLLARGATLHLPIVEPDLPPHLGWRGDPRVHASPGVSACDEAQLAAYYGGLPGLWGSIHLAGGFAMAPIEATQLADLEQQWRLNTVTCFLACREAVIALRRTGQGGRIVSVAARPVLQPASGMLSYVAAKAGVAAITQALAAEVLADGILVNAIVPSIIDSPANRAAMPDADHARWPTPAELAETIAFLASPENRLTTGALVPVYGRA
jgi:NAD(P)-dependent dehydrogenase (short-subunit alcohol dehydrogenase family)